MSKIFSDNAQTIGGTPLVKINHISDGNIYAKLENRNPAMSVKCRIGTSMVAAAEADGSLKPNSTRVSLRDRSPLYMPLSWPMAIWLSSIKRRKSSGK